MAQLIADRKDVDFVLHEQFQISELSRHGRFAEFNKQVIDMIITEARTLAIKEILPTRKIGDRTGCRYENGEVRTPAEFKRVWKHLIDGGWFAPSADTQWGGQGMPKTLAIAAQDYLVGANLALLMVVVLNHGAGRLIERFGTDKQKRLYLKKIYSGEWGGTMLLTESESGSDLGSLTTSAVKNPDGTYSLTGGKIFISAGDHDLTENIINPVLARIEGAPEGSRGISLFLVPKIHVNDDGSLGERNDIVCAGIEEKMGLHGSPTCSMSLGNKGKCIGTLLGEENKGLSAMFLMMNSARLMVASQGLACASSSYMHALSFARTRIQGALLGERDKRPVPIIRHPDVRRMLLTMKAYTEGMRSLLYYIAWCEDRKSISKNSEEKERYQNRIDFLIPVAKSYVTDRSVDICNIGIQVHGGYGYTSEYPVEQLLRDVRITSIYEGTNGIQAIDLLGRKLTMNEGKLFADLMDDIRQTVTEAKRITTIRPMADRVETAVYRLIQAANHVRQMASGSEAPKAFAYACPFLDVTGDVAMAWMLLWRAMLAVNKQSTDVPKADVSFYQGQVKSAEFFIRSVLPVTFGRIDSILDACGAPMEISNESFGGL
jgi:alkylation response protein AidB-like acyl-CoA dehydrogenase